MQVITSDKTVATVALSLHELLALSNALNEVCNALELPEFSSRMGIGRDEAMTLLHQFGALYDELSAND